MLRWMGMVSLFVFCCLSGCGLHIELPGTADPNSRQNTGNTTNSGRTAPTSPESTSTDTKPQASEQSCRVNSDCTSVPSGDPCTTCCGEPMQGIANEHHNAYMTSWSQSQKACTNRRSCPKIVCPTYVGVCIKNRCEARKQYYDNLNVTKYKQKTCKVNSDCIAVRARSYCACPCPASNFYEAVMASEESKVQADLANIECGQSGLECTTCPTPKARCFKGMCELAQ